MLLPAIAIKATPISAIQLPTNYSNSSNTLVYLIKRKGIAMQNFQQFTAIIEREDDQYVALCPELDIASQGDYFLKLLLNRK